MPSPTRRNSPKKILTSAQKAEIRKSLAKFNGARNTLTSTYKQFNAGAPPSEKAMLAALRALAEQRGGTRRRSRH